MPGSSSSNIPPAFNLDDNSTQNPDNDTEKVVEDVQEAEVQFFMRQTRLWRVINSAQWVAWGVVQAKMPGMEEGIAADLHQNHQQDPNNESEGNGSNGSTVHEHAEPAEPGPETPENDEDGFDYLAYAQDRAMIFWADMLGFGLVGEEELPVHVREHVKTRVLEY